MADVRGLISRQSLTARTDFNITSLLALPSDDGLSKPIKDEAA